MKRTILSILSCSALATLLAAQTGSPPGISKAMSFSSQITVGSNGSSGFSSISQISHQQLPRDPAGTWTTCLSGGGLATAFGGVGGSDMLIGRWNRLTKKFTRTTEAAKLNSTGTDFGLMLDSTGRHAVFDRASGPFYAFRVAPGIAFSTATAIAGITGVFVDPALGRINGKLVLFFIIGPDIVMQSLDVSNPTAPKVTGTAVIVAKTMKSGGTANSPTPLIGKDGDTEGLFAADVVSPDNDMTFNADLNPATPALMFVNTNGWINNGGVAGGMFTFANANQVSQVETAWLVGDDEAIGKIADITGAVIKGGATPAITVLFMAAKEITPLPKIGSFFGNFALDIPTLFVLGSMPHLFANETASISFPIPNDTRLKNISVALQGLSVDTNSGNATFTNTAFLSIR